MKTLSKALLLSGLVAASGIITSANAAGSCNTCGGYFYTAVSTTTNNYGMNSQHFTSVGPFADEESCWIAVQDDYGNNDNWLPYEGSPKCKWRYETNYEVYADIIKDWNNVSNPTNPGVIADEEAIAKIAELREVYRVKEYEVQLHSAITDPNNDPDGRKKKPLR